MYENICVIIKLVLPNIFGLEIVNFVIVVKMDNLEKRLNQQTNTTCLLIQNLND